MAILTVKGFMSVDSSAHDTEESTELVKAGFEYVTGEYDDRGEIFKKAVWNKYETCVTHWS